MKERPILFSGPMVRAILEGRKMQTRRVCKSIICTDLSDMPQHLTRYGAVATVAKCPYGQEGDRLWVRETWATYGMDALPDQERPLFYRADDVDRDGWATPPDLKWKPSIHMPRWASRITLEVTGVRVERLQDIRAHDAIAEGVEISDLAKLHALALRKQGRNISAAVVEYGILWESINGPGSWDVNPWVWVVEFKRVQEGGAA